MASNFDFLAADFPDLFQFAQRAENYAQSDPRSSCFWARYTLEQLVSWLYDNDTYLDRPRDTSLNSLIHERTFQENLNPPSLFHKIRLVQRLGNRAAHDSQPLDAREALQCLRELHHLLYWLARYYSPNGRNLGAVPFDPALLQPADRPQSTASQKRIEALEQELAAAQQERDRLETERRKLEADYARQVADRQQELASLKQRNRAVPDRHNYNEAETRKYQIDLLLREAGWNPNDPRAIEVAVSGMPTSTNPSGKGKIDYVLWGSDGRPLAIVEAKRASKDPKLGQQQAKLYADCLEAQYGQRPVIFYSNGYEHYIWDDLRYPPRAIAGFLSADELERIIFRRRQRKPLEIMQPNPEIAGRSYQITAIRSIAERFDRGHRKALLVMATGTGKTRTAIALIDLLQRANWVNRVLFLADRTALLTQAKRAIQKTMGEKVSVADLTRDQDAASAQIVLSTYPTILNRIDQTDSNGKRIFGSGCFDLVIVDEAHRSIYQKYRAIFEYFDSLLVGLTATPRDEVHRDTYAVFDLDPGLPTFAYELNEAIDDGYLVPPTGIDVPFKFLRRGIKYQELSPDEQTEYEARFADLETGEIPDQINAAALNQWLFNENTVDQALEVLMQQGLKVDQGDRLGKTIIFARNHQHAEYIVERFNSNYPHFRGQFAKVIDSKDGFAQTLLDEFSDPKKDLSIAVSVDMLDTGVDVPEVVNLVFFKPVYSLVKFNQMIGRGTRLRPDLFAPGDNKTAFLIFDLCSNFAYFAQPIKEVSPKLRDSLSARLVKIRLQLSQAIDSQAPDPQLADLQTNLLSELHQHVATMEPANFLVRRQARLVQEFTDRDRWNRLSREDVQTISDRLANLPNSQPTEPPQVKAFDELCLQIQLARLQALDRPFIALRDRLRDVASALETKRTIPQIQPHLSLIADIQEEAWWQDVTVTQIETVRQQLRSLATFIDREKQTILYTQFTDELMGEITEAHVPTVQSGFSREQYRKKVEAYIRAHQDHIAIAKLRRNIPLTPSDLIALEQMLFESPEVEGRDRFEQVYGADYSLPKFIRCLVGLDRQAAKEAFAEYLTAQRLNTGQIRFVEMIIDHLTQNGIMAPALLYEPPFTDLHQDGLDGLFGDDRADQIVAIVESINQNAEAA
ncbi:MAG: DUF4145 domain-containing protein [Limnothrix sp. CACIAM 69d]|nr:MAG: DUF4145 domain-containing protein [Limnothrix sp. CACIAM 69d]